MYDYGYEDRQYFISSVRTLKKGEFLLRIGFVVRYVGALVMGTSKVKV